MRKVRTIYYSDELNDDFAGTNIKTKSLPEDYHYFKKNPIVRFLHFFLYYVIAAPIVYISQKIMFQERIHNRKALKPYRKTGFYIYGNHTRMAGDAFTSPLAVFPKKAFVLANPDCVSIPVVGHITEALGCVPLPTSIKGLKNFHEAVLEHGRRGHAVVIFPEAHIWPYYTKIRPFKAASFRYPAELNKPVFTFTVTYQKFRFSKKPRTNVYIDGPFFPKEGQTVKQNQLSLRDMAYQAMQERSKLSNVEYVHYEKVDKPDEK